jgi:DNA polymerase-3 subunit epsilon
MNLDENTHDGVDVNAPSRHVTFDCETTGLHPDEGDKMVEAGFYEIIDRKPTGRFLHLYFDPKRDVPDEAKEVHGHSRDDLVRLSGKRVFADRAQEIIDFIRGAKLVAHNAKFDTRFFDMELKVAGLNPLSSYCEGIIDSLAIAQRLYPGQRNSLDALLNRLVGKDNYERELHGALLDARLLSQVYLIMTVDQKGLEFNERSLTKSGPKLNPARLQIPAGELVIAQPSDVDREAHAAMQARIRKSSGGSCIEFGF